MRGVRAAMQHGRDWQPPGMEDLSSSEESEDKEEICNAQQKEDGKGEEEAQEDVSYEDYAARTSAALGPDAYDYSYDTTTPLQKAALRMAGVDVDGGDGAADGPMKEEEEEGDGEEDKATPPREGEEADDEEGAAEDAYEFEKDLPDCVGVRLIPSAQHAPGLENPAAVVQMIEQFAVSVGKGEPTLPAPPTAVSERSSVSV